MSDQKKQPEGPIVYDLNRVKEFTDYPVRVVCAAINTIIEPVIEDPNRLSEIKLGVDEMVKDVEVHGGESNPKIITILKRLGGISIFTMDSIKDRSEHNGFGRIILSEMFGDDYSTEIEGNVFKSHLFIRTEYSTDEGKRNEAA
jgi:hypothetical protein